MFWVDFGPILYIRAKTFQTRKNFSVGLFLTLLSPHPLINNATEEVAAKSEVYLTIRIYCRVSNMDWVIWLMMNFRAGDVYGWSYSIQLEPPHHPPKKPTLTPGWRCRWIKSIQLFSSFLETEDEKAGLLHSCGRPKSASTMWSETENVDQGDESVMMIHHGRQGGRWVS